MSDDVLLNRPSSHVSSLAQLPVSSSSSNFNILFSANKPTNALAAADTFVSDQMKQLSSLEWSNNLVSCLDNSFSCSSSMLLSSTGSENIWLKAAIEAQNRNTARAVTDKPYCKQSNQTATETDSEANKQSTGYNLATRNPLKSSTTTASNKVSRSLFESFMVDRSETSNPSCIVQQPDSQKFPDSHVPLSSSNAQTSKGVFSSVSLNDAACTSAAVSSFTLDLKPVATRSHMTCRLVPLTTVATSTVSKAAAGRGEVAVLSASGDTDCKTPIHATVPRTTTCGVNRPQPGKNVESGRTNETVELPGSTNTSAVSSRSAIDPIIKCKTEQCVAQLRKGGISRLGLYGHMSCGATGQSKAYAVKTSKHCAPTTWQVVTTKSELEDCCRATGPSISKGDWSLLRVPPLKLSMIKNGERGDEKSCAMQHHVESFSNAQKPRSLRVAGNQSAYCSASESALMDTQRLKAKRYQTTCRCTVPRGVVNKKRFLLFLRELRDNGGVFCVRSSFSLISMTTTSQFAAIPSGEILKLFTHACSISYREVKSTTDCTSLKTAIVHFCL